MFPAPSQRKFSLRLSPQPWSGGRISRTLAKEGVHYNNPALAKAEAHRPGNQVAKSSDGGESGVRAVGGEFIVEIQ